MYKSKELEMDIQELLFRQLDNFWKDYDKCTISKIIPDALYLMEKNYSAMPSTRFYNNDNMIFSPYYSVTWMIFLYRLAYLVNIKKEDEDKHEAAILYYLNKIMHSVDWYYEVKLPVHFMAEHPLGSVLGRAEYGDYLFVYQGTTVGGNRKDGKLYYPVLGNNILIYANSTILGNCHIGNNVIISAESYIINETIPDNCIVFGKLPDIVIKNKSEEEIKDMTSFIWKW